MNADAFRRLYDFHFAENRMIWDWYVPDLPPEQFMQVVDYSRGSVRDQLVHLMNVDVAHRLSTIREADKIVVLEDNRIREMGTHEELIQLEDGLYRRLYNVQRQMEPIPHGFN